MSRSYLNRYHVHSVPGAIRPLYDLYAYGLGALLFFLSIFLNKTIKLNIAGRENLAGHANHIFCLWHGYVPLIAAYAAPKMAAALDGAPQVWMQHPMWYMKPIHVLLRLLGVKELILGSTGHSGRKAADRLVVRLRQGCSTVINPDGPHGPALVLKKGILHLALQSAVPVVALRFSLTRYVELNSWDCKKLACPFSTIELKIGSPIKVTHDNFDRAEALIIQQLGS